MMKLKKPLLILITLSFLFTNALYSYPEYSLRVPVQDYQRISKAIQEFLAKNRHITFEDLGLLPLIDLPSPKKDLNETRREISERVSKLSGRSVIFTAGPSGVGKTTLLNMLSTRMERKVVVFSLDKYFKSISDRPKTKSGEIDFDHPDGLNLAQASNDIKRLLRGERIELPGFDMSNRRSQARSGKYLQLGENEVLVVEGIHALHEQLLASVNDDSKVLRIFIDAPPILRFLRRLKRDVEERQLSYAWNVRYWPVVLLNERQSIRATKNRADIIFDNFQAEEGASIQRELENLINESLREKGALNEVATLLDSWRKAIQESLNSTSYEGDWGEQDRASPEEGFGGSRIGSEAAFPTKMVSILKKISFGMTTPPVVVELGAGNGLTAKWIYDQGFHVLGLERSRSYLDRAMEKYQSHSRILENSTSPESALLTLRQSSENMMAFKEADFSNAISLPDESVDSVVLHRTLSMNADAETRNRIIREAFRILRPGGVISFLDFRRVKRDDAKGERYQRSYNLSREVLNLITDGNLPRGLAQILEDDTETRFLLVMQDQNGNPVNDLDFTAEELRNLIESGKVRILFTAIHAPIATVAKQFQKEGFNILVYQDARIPSRITDRQSFLSGFVAQKPNGRKQSLSETVASLKDAQKAVQTGN